MSQLSEAHVIFLFPSCTEMCSCVSNKYWCTREQQLQGGMLAASLLSNAASALPPSAAVHCVHRGQVSVSLFVASSMMFFFFLFFVVVSKHK